MMETFNEVPLFLTVLSVLSRMASGGDTVPWSQVELSTCDAPMVGLRLSLCCYTSNIPKEASIFFYTKTKGGNSYKAFYRLKPQCMKDVTFPNQGLNITMPSCTEDGSTKIYNVTVLLSNSPTMFENTWGCGYYGNFSSLELSENQVLTSYHGTRLFTYNDQVTLTWMLNKSSNKPLPDVDIYRPSGDKIAHILNGTVKYYTEGFNVSTENSARVSMLITNVSAQNNGTYVCAYNGSGTNRDGITLVLLGQPKTPTIAAGKPQTNGNMVSGHMICNSSSQSAAPPYYKSRLLYRWIIPSTLDDPNFSGVIIGNGSISFPEVNCASVSSLPLYCQATEGNLTSPFSPPMNLSSFCVKEEVAAEETHSSTFTLLVTFLCITVFLLVTFLSVFVVVGRKFLKKKTKRCCNTLCCRSNSSDSDSDLENVLQEPRERGRWDRFSDILRANIEGNDNQISLADGLERRRDDVAVQEALERHAIEESLQSQYNRQGHEGMINGEDNEAFNRETETDIRDIGAVGGAEGGDVGGADEGVVLPRSTPTREEENDSLEAVERLLEMHNRHLSPKAVHLDVNRDNIVQHLLQLYTDTSIAQSRVTIKMVGERGYDGGGVTDDMYTTFWYRTQETYFQGCEAVVPFLALNKWATEEEYYRILGRILSHTVALTKALPLPLCKSAFIVMIFDTTNVDMQAILEDFLHFLDPIDRSLVTSGMNNFDSLTSDQVDEIQSIFSRFEYPAVIHRDNFHEHLGQLARNTICIRPKPLLDLMRQGIPQSHFEHFWSMLTIGYIEVLFWALQPNPARVIARLKTDPTERNLTRSQRKVFQFLKDFIQELSLPEIETFLHFLTGKKSTPRQTLVVCFTKDSGFQRAPRAHTCSNMLELPETYENYKTFKSEFKHLLAANEAMIMTMA